MEIEYGATVLDKNGQNLGTVDYIIRDSWSGEVKKFVIHRHPEKNDLFLPPDHVQEADQDTVKMDLPLDQLEQL
jgi:sporulation protein YlmC with PRC-barrel domain